MFDGGLLSNDKKRMLLFNKSSEVGFAMEGDIRTMQDEYMEVIGRTTQEIKSRNCRMPT